jgi:tetratricopeptide (TPR) repeat protein
LAGDSLEQAESLVWVLTCAMFGPTPVAQARRNCESIASRSDASQKVRAMASIERGVLEAMSGGFDQGRQRVAAGRRALDELGLAYLATATAQEAALVERLANDPSAAEAILRPALARFGEIGERALYSTDAGMLAHVLYDQERVDEAESWLEVCRASAAAVDVMSHYLWKSAQAKVLAHRGNDRAALPLVEDALILVAATDFVVDHGDRLVDLADIHSLAGRHERALRALDQAEATYDRKGCTASKAWTSKRRARLEGTSPQSSDRPRPETPDSP